MEFILISLVIAVPPTIALVVYLMALGAEAINIWRKK